MSAAPRAVLRADASSTMGIGHAMRCLALGEVLSMAGWQVALSGRKETIAALPTPPAVPFLPLEDCGAGTLEAAIGGAIDLLVVDHYGLGAEFEQDCRNFARRILVVDDLADRAHDCDILVDQTFGREGSDYAGLVPESARLLMGSHYALVRGQFLSKRAAAIARRDGRPARNLLISLGGADPRNTTVALVDALAAAGLLGDCCVTVVAGPAAGGLEELRERAERLAGIRLLVGADDMATLTAEADVAIGAAGSSTWERCALGLPTVQLVIADNQRTIARNLSAAGAVTAVENVADAVTALRRLLAGAGTRQVMAARAQAVCDGRGTQRVLAALADCEQSARGGALNLRLAESADEDLILTWQRAPETRRFARNPAIPTPEEHAAWMARRLLDPDCLFTIIEEDSVSVGVLRLDRMRDQGESVWEVSILVDPARHGRGIGAGALRLARNLLPGASLIATVLPGNHASAKLFERAGYTATSDASVLIACP